METEMNFFDGIKKLLTYHNIISISGESGTGKTTLTLQLVGTFLISEQPYQDTCIWIQASELFSLKRLHQLFQGDSNNEKLNYIQQNIYVIPQKGIISTYKEQSTLIHYIIDPHTTLPPSLKFIVVDNISHHLRYRLTQYYNTKEALSLLDAFYETQLMPLILFCMRHDYILILIHEVSYHPQEEGTKPFFHKLYSRIRTIDIVLGKNLNSEKKTLNIFFDKINWNFLYTLRGEGLLIEY